MADADLKVGDRVVAVKNYPAGFRNTPREQRMGTVKNIAYDEDGDPVFLVEHDNYLPGMHRGDGTIPDGYGWGYFNMSDLEKITQLQLNATLDLDSILS